MRYNELSQEEYTAALKVVIIGAEGLHARAQDVGDGMATIGYGYTFNRGNNAAIWRDSAINLTEDEWRALQAIDAGPVALPVRNDRASSWYTCFPKFMATLGVTRDGCRCARPILRSCSSTIRISSSQE